MHLLLSMLCGSDRGPVMACDGHAFTHCRQPVHFSGITRYSTKSRQRPAGQRRSRTCARYSLRKYFRVESTGFGAVLPKPHSAAPLTTCPSVSSLSMSATLAVPLVTLSNRSARCRVPTRQGTHLPQDSLSVNVRKYFARSTTQVSSPRMIRPPEPMIDPALVS